MNLIPLDSYEFYSQMFLNITIYFNSIYVKLLENTSVEELEKSINLEIRDKIVSDIKYSTFNWMDANQDFYSLYSALIIFDDIKNT